MPDYNGNERFLFSIPSEFAIGINAKTEAEAWLLLRTWLNANRLYDLDINEQDPEKHRKPREDLSAVTPAG